jgi:hypothetical protein
MSSPEMRAPNVPADAVWNEADMCWEHGPTTAGGEKHGTWRSWYASGAERGVVSFEDGVLDGTETVWTGGNGERPFDDSFAENVARADFLYDRGVLIRQRCFTADGVEVGSDGEPLPERPEGVPADASYIPPAELWVDGPMLGGAPMTGRQRMWHRDGELLSDIGWKDGKHHGSFNTYGYGEHAIEEPGAPVGPPLTRRIQAEYIDGEIRSARFFAWVSEGDEKEEVELAAAAFEGGKLHGPLRWLTRWHMTFSKPIVSIEELELEPSALFQPRRLPGTHRIEADFDHGNAKAIRAFDKKRQPPRSPAPGRELGPGHQPRAARRLPLWRRIRSRRQRTLRRRRSCHGDRRGRRTRREPLQPTAEPHKAAAFALDRFVRSGAMPSMQTFQLSGYGFDCVKNELYDAEDERYFGLGYDGFGDLYLLDVDTGGVRRWGHDRDPWEDGAEFASLDAFAFGILRNELVNQQRIDRAEMESCFTRLGFAWLAPT